MNYKKEILPKLKEKFGYTNDLEVPRFVKVAINVGFGKHTKEKDYIDNVASTLERISGQKAVLTKAKKSISAFKVREGMTIGAMVTIRGKRMLDFLDKLVKVTFPNIRDFRGMKNDGIDKMGNMTIGFKEHIAFGEIRSDEMEKLHGLEISIVTTAKNYEEGKELFKLAGFPFVNERPSEK